MDPKKGMKIEQRRLVDINPYKQNARKIPQRAIDKVASSLKEFGWQQPIVIDKQGVIVVGHTRWLAAQQLGFPPGRRALHRQMTSGLIRRHPISRPPAHAAAVRRRRLAGSS